MPVRLAPNAGIEARYQKNLDQCIDAMFKDVERSIRAQWRRKPPIASDASPAAMLRDTMNRLAGKWLKAFDLLGPEVGNWFATQAALHADNTVRAASRDHSGLMAILRQRGFTVRFKATAAEQDILTATVAESVSLIRSIPDQALKSVEGIIMRGVQVGGDLGQITKDLQKQHGVAKRRAAFIARDQNFKANAALTRNRQLEMGLTKSQWLHSSAGKEPRPSHVAFDRKLYDIAKGIVLDPKEGICWPGTLPGCRCVSGLFLPGFDD